VKFRVPGRSEIEARGRVVWSDRAAGMGIQFEFMSASDQQVIDGLTGNS
jgi:hypothetical protein